MQNPLPQHELLVEEAIHSNESPGIEVSLHIPEELQPLLENMPEPQAKAVKAIFVGMSITRHTSFRGPLPPPGLLKEYNDIIPNGAERILVMSEKQSDHRMQLERTVISREQNQSGRGQLYGLIIALTFLVASFILIYTGHDIPGVIIGSIDLVALVSVFVIGKLMQKR